MKPKTAEDHVVAKLEGRSVCKLCGRIGPRTGTRRRGRWRNTGRTYGATEFSVCTVCSRLARREKTHTRWNRTTRSYDEEKHTPAEDNVTRERLHQIVDHMFDLREKHAWSWTDSTLRSWEFERDGKRPYKSVKLIVNLENCRYGD